MCLPAPCKTKDHLRALTHGWQERAESPQKVSGDREGCAFQSEWILATFTDKSVVCDVVEKSVSWQCRDLENNVRIHLFIGVDSSEFC